MDMRKNIDLAKMAAEAFFGVILGVGMAIIFVPLFMMAAVFRFITETVFFQLWDV